MFESRIETQMFNKLYQTVLLKGSDVKKETFITAPVVGTHILWRISSIDSHFHFVRKRPVKCQLRTRSPWSIENNNIPESMNSYEILTRLRKVYVNKEMLRLLTVLPYPKGFNNTLQSIIPLITSIGN